MGGRGHSRSCVKIRETRWPFLAAFALADNGIEKVRGSTPLISTIHKSAFDPMKSRVKLTSCLSDSALFHPM